MIEKADVVNFLYFIFIFLFFFFIKMKVHVDLGQKEASSY